MRRRTLGLLLIIAGLLFALVPLTMIEYKSLTRHDGLERYVAAVEQADAAEQAQRLAAAQDFNTRVLPTGEDTRDPFGSEIEEQESTFALEGEEFAHVVIPSIELSQPVFLGASQKHMSMGLAQVEGTSLPVGGEGSRSVLAGHNGWYNNHFLLFADRLVPGDRIFVAVLGEVLEYEVYGTEIILPSEGEKLAAIDGQDTLTLLTCTPAPINDKRLLINARRVAPQEPGAPQAPVASPAVPSPPSDAAKPATSEFGQAVQETEQHDVAVPAAVKGWAYATRAAIVLLALGVVWALVRLYRGGRNVVSHE
ncbi:MAG: class C sortase [Propionibacteriaceae bacterium]|nr:class C sortase [Propionibacteriaceae bacterium]